MVEKQDFEALIVRYLEGSATPEEAMALEDWKQQAPENQKMYDQYEQLLARERLNKVDTDDAWKVVHHKISRRTKVIPLKKWSAWAVAAAAIVLIALIVPGLLESNGQRSKETPEVIVKTESKNILYAKNGVKSYELEDKSKVELKNGSSLELSDNFKNGERRASLKGSGRFTVIHDEDHPFIISVEGLEVHDVGTIFDITTHKDTVKVIVEEGSVELRKNGQVLAIEEGDSAFYLISQRLIQEYPTPQALEGITKTFENTPLKDIVAHLSQFFKREMVIMDESLKEATFTLPFHDQELPMVISILEDNGLRIVQRNNKIEIYEGI